MPGQLKIYFDNSFLLSDTKKSAIRGINYQHCILHKLLIEFTNF